MPTVTPAEKAELVELVREAVRAELGRPKVDDRPKAEVTRRKPRPEVYERVRRRMRRLGLDE